MPGPLEDNDPEINLTPGTTKSDIIVFLYETPEQGFRPSKIAEQLNIPNWTATETLKRLHEADHVAKTDDGHYHAVESRADLRRYVASHAQLVRMFEQAEKTPDGAGAPDTIDEAALDAELERLEDSTNPE